MNIKSLGNKIFLILVLFSNNIFCHDFDNNNNNIKDSVDFYVDKNNPAKTINFARKKTAQLLYEKKYDEYCTAMLKKSSLYEQFNDKENALKVLFEALSVAEKHNLTEKQILIYKKTGDINNQIFEYTKSKKYLKIAEKTALKYNNKELLIQVYRGLFKVYSETSSDSTFYFLKKIEFYSKGLNNLEIKYKNYSNFSQYYLSVSDNKLGKKYIDSAYSYALKIGDKKFISRSYGNLGYYYMVVEKNYQKSKDIFIQLIKTFPKNSEPEILGNAYLNAAESFRGLGDFENAYLYQDMYIALQDDVVNGKISQSNQALELKYTTNKVENEFKEKEKKILEKQERNQKLLLLFASLFIFTGIIFYFYYQNLLLKEKNKLKDIDAKLQYKIISATLDGQDQERNKISAILHDHVSAVLSSVGLHLSAFESSLTKEQIADLKKTRSLLKNAHDKVRDLSHELVPPLLVKFGLQFALRDLCENNTNSIIQFEFYSTLEKNQRYNAEFETKIFFIVSELLNNVMKHSKASKSKLLLEEIDGKLHITIEDNGIGFNLKNISISNGFGITQIRARIKNMKGDLKIKSKIGQGTIIYIKIDDCK
ncbi:sensor histidine kinase [Flavobacterium psychrophilum]|uniref:sensor histidine kinase n=2 Tax=Flavobacterium psychrophilum TaxID=96345 RepID=UPI000B7C3783|nr:ATP-binding protein [Flavobacterium psychrophilum]MBM4675725.1 hypothetical protein [Flavobacterium psychrophilum]MCB5999379.1 histidine kinase [Flavobacterium psychrophilum]MCB6014186.1 histidine kinase [Flavobacterium psychrophilum]MCB6021779.1 histidine kinase [Flavobacterium psychrophilum]MCB6031442.1 histidine kinase [Flavobacterium psychrophilum]